MKPMDKTIVVACLGVAAYLALGERGQARADLIGGSWSGASASVYFGDQTQSQQGSAAQASTGGSVNVSYQGSSSVPTSFQATVTGNLAANAGGDPAHLLRVTASSDAPDPGTLLAGAGGKVSGGTQASWTNDAAIVTAAAGSSPPDTVRLNFTLTFSDPHGIGPYAGLTATYNGTQLSYWGSDMTPGPAASLYGQATMGLHSSASNAGAVDSSAIVSSNNWQTQLTDTFHIDLAVNNAGLSTPFGLSLQLTPTMGLFNNSPVTFSGLTANIALSSITLPDGTPLSALGDSVSFESGLAAPTATPEPASWLIWGLVAATAGATAVRRRHRARGR